MNEEHAKCRTQIIVEIGLNHLGCEDRAWRMLESTNAISIDAVTFQIRERAFYEKNDPSRRRLSHDFYGKAVDAIHARGQRCGIAIADESSVAEFGSFDIDFWKTLSWDFKNESLKKQLDATGKPILMSTGLSSMDEIVDISSRGGNIVLIHTQLSQRTEDVNIKAVEEMRTRTNLRVAFGLHCANHDVLKVALGVEPYAVLFYIKEDGNENPIDDEHAIFTSHVKQFADNLCALGSALGTGKKNSHEKPGWVLH